MADNPEAWRVVTPAFTKITKTGLVGAEGPVFDKDGNFYMVAPEVVVDGKAAGEIVTVDISSGKVGKRGGGRGPDIIRKITIVVIAIIKYTRSSRWPACPVVLARGRRAGGDVNS